MKSRTEPTLSYFLSYFANTAPYSIFPGVSIEVKGHMQFNKLHLGWLYLNPVEFKQALSTHELYQQEVNAYLLESTFTKLSIENLVAERIKRTFYSIEINLSSLF